MNVVELNVDERHVVWCGLMLWRELQDPESLLNDATAIIDEQTGRKATIKRLQRIVMRSTSV